MPRYFTKPQTKTRHRPRCDDFDWSDDIPRSSNIEVSDHEPTDTGLLDVHGSPIWRAPNPVGFIWEFSE